MPGADLDRPVVIVDAGARWGVDPCWRRIPGARVIGFEPDAAECARLRELDPGTEYVAMALGALDGEIVLHLTKDPACSSFYAPDERVAEHRPELRVIDLVGTMEVPVTTLDHWMSRAGIDAVHVLKLDTQGSELDVLRGAALALETVRFLEIEVELNPIYEDQPLFGDVDRFLRERGFVLWRLQDLVHYGLRDADSSSVSITQRHYFDSHNVEVAGAGGQLYWAHAYFVARDLAFPTGDLPPEDGYRDACIAAALGFDDLAISIRESIA